MVHTLMSHGKDFSYFLSFVKKIVAFIMIVANSNDFYFCHPQA
jgi:hypothetical protein